MNKGFMSYLIKKTHAVFVESHNMLESHIIFSLSYSSNLQNKVIVMYM